MSERIKILVGLEIEMLGREAEEIVGSIEAAPPNIHGMTIGGATVVAYRTDGTPVIPNLDALSWIWMANGGKPTDG